MNQDWLPMPLDSFLPTAVLAHLWFWLLHGPRTEILSLAGPAVFVLLTGGMSILKGLTSLPGRKLLVAVVGLTISLGVISPILSVAIRD
jgi:hypothetical protein